MDATTTHQAQDESSRRVPLLADTPLRNPEQDGFGFVEFAHALVLVVDNVRTATPLTVAVSAPWGGGKSSVGYMVQTLLEQRVARRGGDDSRLVVWFNAWEHADAPHLGAALAAAVAREASRHRAWWRRALFPLPTAMLGAGEGFRRTALIAAFSLAAAALLAVAEPTRSLGEEFLGAGGAAAGALGAFGVVGLAVLVFQRVFATAKSAARFIDDPRSEAARGTMAEVKHQLSTLICHATRDGRLVILIDDLERCESARALEVCQVASQLLAQPDVVTILLADMSPIAASAGVRYALAGAGSRPAEAVVDVEDIGRRYLEKIVQLELAMPPPDPAAMRRVICDYGRALREVESGPEVPRRFLGVARRATLSGWAPAIARLGRRGAALRGVAERAVARAGWWPPIVAFGVLTVITAIAPQADGEPPEPAATAFTIVIFAGIAGGFWSRRLRRQQRERRADYKRRIEELKERGDLSQDQVRAEVIRNDVPEGLDADHELIRDLVSSSFLDSDEFRAVERFIADHPPRLPRAGKRTFNHAQLLTEIARARHMFGGDPPLTPEHLAKWVVVKERWPAFARAVLVEPEILAGLEAAATGDQLGAELASRELQLTDVLALNALLRGEPELAPLIERLIYFRPAALPLH